MPPSCCVRLIAFLLQIASFAIGAAASGIMLVRWRRIGARGLERGWPLYGVFTATMLGGCCLGIVAWIANMQEVALLLNIYGAEAGAQGLSKDQLMVMIEGNNRWHAVSIVVYSVEFLFLCVTKLLALDRLLDFQAGIFVRATVVRRWGWIGSVTIRAVLLGSMVGVCGNVVAAYYVVKAADLASEAASAYRKNQTHAGNALFSLVEQNGQKSNQILAVQLFSEVSVLLLIVIVFTVVGIMCIRRVKTSLHSLPSFASSVDTAGRKLVRQIFSTVIVLFVTFLLRAVYSLMFALSSFLQNDGSNVTCRPCEASCYNVYTLMQYWLLLTPELKLVVVLISSPLALLVALWGMTSDHILAMMRTKGALGERHTSTASPAVSAAASLRLRLAVDDLTDDETSITELKA